MYTVILDTNIVRQLRDEPFKQIIEQEIQREHVIR